MRRLRYSAVSLLTSTDITVAQISFLLDKFQMYTLSKTFDREIHARLVNIVRTASFFLGFATTNEILSFLKPQEPLLRCVSTKTANLSFIGCIYNNLLLALCRRLNVGEYGKFLLGIRFNPMFSMCVFYLKWI